MSDQRSPAKRDDDLPAFDPVHPSKLLRRGLARLGALTARSDPAGLADPTDQAHLLWTFPVYSRRYPGLADGRPDIPVLFPEDIPRELTERRQWVCWEWGWRTYWVDGYDVDGWGKVPISPVTGGPERGPVTWGSFDEALAFRQRHGIAGIGFVFSKEDPFAGVDLDGCRNPQTGALMQWAADIVEELGSYTEVSPSGTGIHIILSAASPPPRLQVGEPVPEIFAIGHFLTFSGDHLSNTPRTVEQRQAALDRLPASFEEKYARWESLASMTDGYPWILPEGRPRISLIGGDDELRELGRFICEVEVRPSTITVLTDHKNRVGIDGLTGQPLPPTTHSHETRWQEGTWQGIRVVASEVGISGYREGSDQVVWHQKPPRYDFDDLCDWELLERGIALFYMAFGSIIALDARNGDYLWSLDSVFAVDSFLITDQHIFFVEMSGEFLAIDIATGEVVRRINESQKTRLLAVTNDLVILESGDGIRARRLWTDDEAWFFRWDYEVKAQPSGLNSPTFVTPRDPRFPAVATNAELNDGVLYVGDGINHLIALDVFSGREQWRYPIGGAARFVQVVGDVLYVANSHVLHAIKRPSLDGSQ